MPNVIVGDCRQVLKTLQTRSVHLAVCDPPYNIGYAYDTDFNQGDKLEDADYLVWSEDWMTSVFRVLAENGSFWLACHQKYVSELDVLAKRIGFRKQDQVVWYYAFGQNSRTSLTNSVTYWLYYSKGKQHVFNADAVRIPSARQTTYNDKRANPLGRLPDNTWILRPQSVPEAFSALENAWHIPRIAGTFHQRKEGAANQIPEQLIGRIIRLCSNPDHTVLDAFCGTGTTATVAKKLGRRFVTIELSPEVAKGADARIAAASQGDVLDGTVQSAARRKR